MELVLVENSSQIGFEPSPKWVRVLFGGQFVADSKNTHLLLPGGPPYYYFPRTDVNMDLLEPTDHKEETPLLGKASFWTVRVGERMAQNAAWTYPQPVSQSLDLSPYITFDWAKMDSWFEENEEVYVHPHNPHKRIDILESTRHVQVVIFGQVVADTCQPMLLFETGLPARYYFPRLDVRTDFLLASDKETGCAYKGKANYYSVKIAERIARDIAWYYPYPEIEAIKIKGRIAFFNEHVDAIYVDGEKQAKTKTPWS